MGQTLEQYFSQPKFLTPRRLVLAVIGPQKVGKTTLGLSAIACGPLAMLDYDFGLEGITADFRAQLIKTGFYHTAFSPPTSMLLEQDITNEDYKKAWQRSKEAYYVALNDPRIKTILVDTASEWWEACRLSYFGKLTQVFPMNRYGEPNGDFRKLIRDALERPDKNVILTHKVKDEYANDQRTGRKIFSGMNDVPGLAQMVVEMWKRGKDYGLTIVDCRHKRSLEGTELPAVAADFPMLLSLVHGPEA
jgi:hypothetical protein